MATKQIAVRVSMEGISQDLMFALEVDSIGSIDNDTLADIIRTKLVVEVREIPKNKIHKFKIEGDR